MEPFCQLYVPLQGTDAQQIPVDHQTNVNLAIEQNVFRWSLLPVLELATFLDHLFRALYVR